MSIVDKIREADIKNRIKNNAVVSRFTSGEPKPVNVKVHKKPKTERLYERVSDVLEYLQVISKHGDKILFSYFVGKELREMTYAEFCDTVKHIAAGLTAQGYAGKKVAVIGETSPQWVASYLAVLATGGVAIPMDKELGIDVIEGFLDWVSADAIVYSATFNDSFDNAKENHKSLGLFIPMAPEKEMKRASRKQSGSVTMSLDMIIAAGDKEIEKGYEYPEVADREALAEYLFTSGTTGTSKAVMLSQKNIFSAVTSAVETVDFNPDDVIVSVLPIHHTYELCCMLAATDYGIHVCINDSLPHLIRNLKTFKPTGLVLVPLFVYTMYKRIWSEAKKGGNDRKLKIGMGAAKALSVVGIDKRHEILAQVHEAFGGRLEKIICGGAALNPKMIEFFETIGVSIYEGFGITECAPLVCVSPYYARKYGSVGPAVPCCQARIAEGIINDMGYNEGEIQVKGDNVMIGYFDNEKANADAFTSDGWFRTGDSGYMDTDGYLFITGRLKTLIVLENGKNVFPEEIEEYLGDIEKIAECVVVGRAENRVDNVILTAIVYPDYTKFAPETDEATILAEIENEITAMNKKLPTYKQIKKVELRNTEFEKTTSRKIKRHLVK